MPQSPNSFLIKNTKTVLCTSQTFEQGLIFYILICFWFSEFIEESSGEGSGGGMEDGSGLEGIGREELALYEEVLEYEVQDYLDGWWYL